jgi:hypothetical protein
MRQEVILTRTNRLSLSIAGTAAVALASLPLGIIPANAARVSEGTSESISVVEAASSAAQFNLKSQDSSTGLVASRGRNDGGGRKFVVPVFLQQLLAEFFGIKWYCSPNPGCQP